MDCFEFLTNIVLLTCLMTNLALSSNQSKKNGIAEPPVGDTSPRPRAGGTAQPSPRVHAPPPPCPSFHVKFNFLNEMM